MDVKEKKKHNNHRTDNTPLRRVTNQEQQNQISERDITQLNMRERMYKAMWEEEYVSLGTHHREGKRVHECETL